MEKLIDFLKKEYPNDAMEIQECVELLNQCIGESVSSLKSAFDIAIDQRNFDKMTKLQGFLATITDIQNKLDGYSEMLQLDDSVEETVVESEIQEPDEKQIPDYEALRVDQNIPHTLYETFTHKRPAGFELFGKRYDVKEWKDILVKTCEALAVKDIDTFKLFVNDIHGRKVPYFGKDSISMRAARGITGTDIYVMTNMSANQIRNIIGSMLRRYNVPINDYKIYLKADYTARHE